MSNATYTKGMLYREWRGGLAPQLCLKRHVMCQYLAPRHAVARMEGASRHARPQCRMHASGGCFWSVELAFQRQPGVVATAVGYSGGSKRDPTYTQVAHCDPPSEAWSRADAQLLSVFSPLRCQAISSVALDLESNLLQHLFMLPYHQRPAVCFDRSAPAAQATRKRCSSPTTRKR